MCDAAVPRYHYAESNCGYLIESQVSYLWTIVALIKCKYTFIMNAKLHKSRLRFPASFLTAYWLSRPCGAFTESADRSGLYAIRYHVFALRGRLHHLTSLLRRYSGYPICTDDRHLMRVPRYYFSNPLSYQVFPLGFSV